MNKKWITIIALAVVLLLVLAFCGLNRDNEPVEPTTGPTEATTQPDETVETIEPTEPAPAEPEWESGTLKAAYAEGIFDILGIGTEVEVVGQFKDYYVISGEEYDLLVEKRFVHLNSDNLFDNRTAYARNGAEVFDSVYMREDPVATLTTNTVLNVVEGKGNWVYVEWDAGDGYMLAERISKYRIESGTKPDSGSTEGTTEQPKDGTDVDVGSLSCNQVQGGIILLGAYYGPEQEPDFEPGKGIVIADEVETYLVLGKRDDEVKVTEYDEEYCTIWLENELYVKLPRWLVRMEGDEKYESWNGYTSNGAVVYEEYQLRNEVKKLNRNTEIVVLDEISEKLYSYYHPGCYVVLIDGEVYYMAMDSVSETKYTAPKNNNGGSENNNDGGETNGDIWTPPAL